MKLYWSSYSKNHAYAYEDPNRLIKTNGKAKRASYDMVMSFGRMSEPLTKVQKVDSTTTAKSYNFAYKYEDSSHPTAPTQIGHDHYTYDANGNPTLVTNDFTNTTREMYWDEDNRLMVLSDNGKTSRYTYNATGERIMKSYGTMEGVYINGAPQGITFHETDNFTLYPASIISINKNRFTKHYFIGDKRIASRIGTGLFNNVYGRNGSYVTAGQQDYAERMNQIQTQKEAYYKKVGVAPGVPTEKGAYGDPENTGVGYNAVLTELGNHDVPQGWIQTPHPNTTPNTNPGPPVSWNDPSNPDDPQAGYGYIANDTTKEETFFYHSDHLGSTSYITDEHANITQYDAYLPYGELLVDEHSSSEELPYKFNGKEMDEETGLYYYGARYLNPMASIWYGVDPLAEKNSHISSYVVCSNNPIMRIDPDGRDDYFNSKGKFIRRTETKTNNIYISINGKNILPSQLDLNIKRNRQVMANVVGHYATAVGISYWGKGKMAVGRNPQGMVGIADTKDEAELAATRGANITISVYKGHVSRFMNDYENLQSSLYHESIHKFFTLRGDYSDNTSLGHVLKVHIKQFENEHFKSATQDFQKAIIDKAAEYLTVALRNSKTRGQVPEAIKKINTAIRNTPYELVVGRYVESRKR